MKTKTGLILCIGACMLIGAAWPAAASGALTLTDVKWKGTNLPDLAVPAGTNVTLRVWGEWGGLLHWRYTGIQLEGYGWVIIDTPNDPPTLPLEVTFNPRDLLVPEKDAGGLCGDYRVYVKICSDSDGNVCSNESAALGLSVYDDAPPQIECRENVNRCLNSQGWIEVRPNDVIRRFTDDCGTMYAAKFMVGGGEVDVIRFTCANVGVNPVEVLAYDAAGHQSNICAATVTVQDCTAPTLNCGSPVEFGTDDGRCYAVRTIDPPAGADNCGIVLFEHRFVMIGGDTNVAGHYPGFEAWTAGPVIAFAFPVGETRIEWRAWDGLDISHLNNVSAICTQKITVKDDELPTITADPHDPIDYIADIDTAFDNELCSSFDSGVCGMYVNVFRPHMSDQCPPPWRLWVDVPRLGIEHASCAPSCFPIGVTELFWYAEDNAGNQVLDPFIQTVTIITDVGPSIRSCQDHLVCTEEGQCDGYVNVCPPRILACCAPYIDYLHYGFDEFIVSYVIKYPNGTITDPIEGNNAAGYYPVGITKITWTVIDPVTQLDAQVEQTIDVRDCERPRLCCVPCTCTPTVATYQASDFITAADLIDQLRGLWRLFPVPPFPPQGCGSDCYGWIYDNCPGVELVIVSGIDPATKKPIEVPANYQYTAGVYQMKFLAKDAAGLYSRFLCWDDICTVMVSVVVGGGGNAPQGACCFADGPCQLLTQVDCYGQGGEWQGANTNCSSHPCKRACCLPNGTCSLLTWVDCHNAGGWFNFFEASCSPNPCPQLGACCFENAPCQVLMPWVCQMQGGQYQGPNTVCDPNPCPKGACCFADGTCEMLTRYDCGRVSGVFHGLGVSCGDNPCPAGACCFPSGSCAMRLATSCVAQGGTYQGDGSTCGSVSCPQPSPVAPLNKVGDDTSTPVEQTPTAIPFWFCGSSMGVASVLSLFGLIGIKLTWRRRR